MKTQIAAQLQISEAQIKTVTEWASVYFVQFTQGRPTFVSKKAIAISKNKYALTIGNVAHLINEHGKTLNTVFFGKIWQNYGLERVYINTGGKKSSGYAEIINGKLKIDSRALQLYPELIESLSNLGGGKEIYGKQINPQWHNHQMLEGESLDNDCYNPYPKYL